MNKLLACLFGASIALGSGCLSQVALAERDTDGGAGDAPVGDAPLIDAPLIDAPLAEAPSMDVPPDVPPPDVPTIDVPLTDVPLTDAPAIDAPLTAVCAACGGPTSLSCLYAPGCGDPQRVCADNTCGDAVAIPYCGCDGVSFALGCLTPDRPFRSRGNCPPASPDAATAVQVHGITPTGQFVGSEVTIRGANFSPWGRNLVTFERLGTGEVLASAPLVDSRADAIVATVPEVPGLSTVSGSTLLVRVRVSVADLAGSPVGSAHLADNFTVVRP